MRQLLWLALVLLPAPALAQGTITGVAQDTDGAALPGTAVEAVTAGGIARSTVTNSAGRYEFRDLPPGTYTLRFRLAGFDTLQREGVAVSAREAVTVDGVLRIAPSADVQRRPPPFGVEPDRRCLHEELESAAERARREEARAAMRMFEAIVRTFPTARTQSPSWEEVSDSAAVRRLRMQGQELALKIRWGTNEPLPGWGIAWITGLTKSRYALVDLRDPCGFSYSSEDPAVFESGRYRLLPLTS